MSGNDDSADEIQQAQQQEQMLLQEQINQSNAEIEQKRQSVFAERLNIINANRGQTWTPYKPRPSKSSQNSANTAGQKNIAPGLYINPIKR